MMNEIDRMMDESRGLEVTLKREMFPEGAKFWDDDGTPKATTPDGRVLVVGLKAIGPAADPWLPNPYVPFVREVAWEEFAEVREKCLRMARSSASSGEENSFTGNDPQVLRN